MDSILFPHRSLSWQLLQRSVRSRSEMTGEKMERACAPSAGIAAPEYLGPRFDLGPAAAAALFRPRRRLAFCQCAYRHSARSPPLPQAESLPNASASSGFSALHDLCRSAAPGRSPAEHADEAGDRFPYPRAPALSRIAAADPDNQFRRLASGRHSAPVLHHVPLYARSGTGIVAYSRYGDDRGQYRLCPGSAAVRPRSDGRAFHRLEGHLQRQELSRQHGGIFPDHGGILSWAHLVSAFRSRFANRFLPDCDCLFPSRDSVPADRHLRCLFGDHENAASLSQEGLLCRMYPPAWWLSPSPSW